MVIYYSWEKQVSVAPKDEGVNGDNRLATKGEKYYWLPTKREKNNRLTTGKILTTTADMNRH